MCDRSSSAVTNETVFVFDLSVRLEARSKGTSACLIILQIATTFSPSTVPPPFVPKMNLLISLALAAVASATIYGQVPGHSEGHPNEVLDTLGKLSVVGGTLGLSEKRHNEVLEGVVDKVPIVGGLVGGIVGSVS